MTANKEVIRVGSNGKEIKDQLYTEKGVKRLKAYQHKYGSLVDVNIIKSKGVFYVVVAGVRGFLDAPQHDEAIELYNNDVELVACKKALETQLRNADELGFPELKPIYKSQFVG